MGKHSVPLDHLAHPLTRIQSNSRDAKTPDRGEPVGSSVLKEALICTTLSMRLKVVASLQNYP
jgi:hypothetical protein